MFPEKLASETAKQLIHYCPIIIPCLIVFYRESRKALKEVQGTSGNLRRYEYYCDDGVDEIVTGNLQEQHRTARQFEPRMLLGVIILLLLIYVDLAMEADRWRISYQRVPLALFVIVVALKVQQTQVMPSEGVTSAVPVSIDDNDEVNIDTPANAPLEEVAISMTVVAWALFFNQSAAVLVVHMCMLRMLAAICLVRVYAVKFKVYLYFAAVMGALLLLIFIDHHIFQNIIDPDSDPIRWGSVILSAMTLMVPFNILCMLLRFEHNIASPPIIFHLHINDVTFAFTDGNHDQIPPPYYAMAFSMLGASFVVSAIISAAGVVTLRMEEAGFFTALIAAPSMIGISLVMAATKGQLKNIWEYQDDRVVEGLYALVLDTSPLTDDEAVYPYTGAKYACDDLW